MNKTKDMHQNLLAAISLVKYLESATKKTPKIQEYEEKARDLFNVVRGEDSGASTKDSLEAAYGYAYVTYQFFTDDDYELGKAYRVLRSVVENLVTTKDLFKRAAALLSKFYAEGFGIESPDIGAAVGWATLAANMGGEKATCAMCHLVDLYKDTTRPNVYNKALADYWDKEWEKDSPKQEAK